MPRRAPGFYVSMGVPDDPETREIALDIADWGAEIADGVVGLVPGLGELMDAYELITGEEAAIFVHEVPGVPWHGRPPEQRGVGERAMAGVGLAISAVTLIGGRLRRLSGSGVRGARLIARVARRLRVSVQQLEEVAHRLSRIDVPEHRIATALTRAAESRPLTGGDHEALEELIHALEPLTRGRSNSVSSGAQSASLRAAQPAQSVARMRRTVEVLDREARAAAEIAGLVEAAERRGTRYVRLMPDPPGHRRLQAPDAVMVRRGQPHQRYEITSVTVMGDQPIERVSTDPVDNLARRLEDAFVRKAESRQLTDAIAGRRANAFGEVHVIVPDTLGYDATRVGEATNRAIARVGRRGPRWARHLRGVTVSVMHRASEADLNRFVRGGGPPPSLETVGTFTR